MRTPRIQVLDVEALERICGGMKWQDFPMSTNIEDRRPQSQGGPVPDADWQAEQRGYDTSCWMGADGNPYSGDPNGGPAEPMPDWGGEADGGDYGGDGGY